MEDYKLSERFSSTEIARRVDLLAERIAKDYRGKDLVLVGILNGAFIFLADLVRRLDFPVRVDFVRLASYGDKVRSCGTVRIIKDLELSLQGCHVLIVEDIVDSGVTLKWFLDHIAGLRPESVKICALVDKRERREVEVPVEYVGITVESGFLVGYGLDFSEKHRNLPAIYEVVFDKPSTVPRRSAEGN